MSRASGITYPSTIFIIVLPSLTKPVLLQDFSRERRLGIHLAGLKIRRLKKLLVFFQNKRLSKNMR